MGAFGRYGRDARIRDLEQRLADNERRLAETQALARVGSWEWTIDADGEMHATYSEQMQRIFGRDPEGPPPTREELIDYVLPEDRAAFERLVARIRSTTGPFEHNYRIVDAEGRVRHMQARGHVEGDANGRPARTYGTTQDITELKESQRQLERARRLEAVGQLAGGVAHDFNNLLTVILSHAEYALEADRPETRESLAEIEKAALSAAGLTRQLLLFSSHHTDEAKPVDLSAVVVETKEMLERTVGDHVELKVDAPPGLAKVTLGEGQAQQILVNLVLNARDALPAGGTIAISVRESSGGAPPVSGKTLPAEAPYLVLAVVDCGVGMSEEVAAQAFDPFFTTKPRGQGTGLGLATVYGIAAKAGGQVNIETEPGRGATVSVCLPVSKERPGEVEPPPSLSSPAPAPGQGRIVLVVDNEEAVQTVVCHMLRRHGYRTLAASSGVEAEAILSRDGTTVDLLLTDVLMPGMSGRELASRWGAGAGLPTVYMSGYAGDDASPLGPWEDGATILQKPFTAPQLLRTVGEVVAGRRDANPAGEARE
jgi:two-component system, cell cycle sensor histidine kinase and response regulator CckA